MRMKSIIGAVVCGLALCLTARASELPQVESVERQPVAVQVARLAEALAYLGVPLDEAASERLKQAAGADSDAAAARLVQEALDPLCLIGVHINPESRVKLVPGPAKHDLVEQGWTQFLVKVHNEAGVTAPLRATSPQAQSLFGSPADQVSDRWLEMQMYDAPPLNKALSGLELEYRIIQLYSRDAGKRSAVISMDVGQGTQDIGFRNDVTLTFTAAPAREVTFRILDEHGKAATAALEIRDPQGRVYPSQAKRLAPDFAFHPQVYRHDSETVKLPPGSYTIDVTRGPEYLPQRKTVRVGDGPATAQFRLERWIDPAKAGWWSGDHHIHAAGCKHYTNPTEGVHAPDMMRHCLGEDLKIGANLTWGPCFDYQKQFFTGKEDEVSQYPYLLRYDVEVSGFGSHRSGHLCLLRLKEQIYPGGDSDEHWPTLCLNTLRWAKKQGAITGPAHSGWGLAVPGDDLPNYHVPAFDGIGANEYIVDVTHKVPGPDGELVPAVDFISTVDTPYVWELNIWYHTLNCGFRTRISGETDFPCIYGERVGLGRSYVKVDGPLTYDKWCEGIAKGSNYVGDGRSHLMDFTVGGMKMGQGESEMRLASPGNVKVSANVAALLREQPEQLSEEIRMSDRQRAILERSGNVPAYVRRPYWHIERARIPGGREVEVEVIVNGEPVAKRRIAADGTMRGLSFDIPIERSSWVAMRILPSSHTNPVFVIVDDKPIRASRRSAEWCLAGVDNCWKQKQRFIAPAEMPDAIEAYDHARKVYKQIISESEVE